MPPGSGSFGSGSSGSIPPSSGSSGPMPPGPSDTGSGQSYQLTPQQKTLLDTLVVSLAQDIYTKFTSMELDQETGPRSIQCAIPTGLTINVIYSVAVTLAHLRSNLSQNNYLCHVAVVDINSRQNISNQNTVFDNTVHEIDLIPGRPPPTHMSSIITYIIKCFSYQQIRCGRDENNQVPMKTNMVLLCRYDTDDPTDHPVFWTVFMGNVHLNAFPSEITFNGNTINFSLYDGLKMMGSDHYHLINQSKEYYDDLVYLHNEATTILSGSTSGTGSGAGVDDPEDEGTGAGAGPGAGYTSSLGSSGHVSS